MQKRQLITLHLSLITSLLLLGAGCGRSGDRTVTPPEPAPRVGEVQELQVPKDLGGAEQRAEEPGPPIAEAETPQEICPLTPENVKETCKLSGEVTKSLYKCAFDAVIDYGSGIGQQKTNVVQALVGSVWFPTSERSDIRAVIESQRATVNQVARGSGFMHECDRWESRAVSGVADEAIMVPLVAIGCDTSRVASLSELSKGVSLYLRKGTDIAQVSTSVGDVDGHEGCSPDEITKIAREYVVPVMGR